MVQGHKQDPPLPAKRSRTGKEAAARLSATGQAVLLRAGGDVIEIPVSKMRYQRIATKGQVLAKVIAGYADTIARARRIGKTSVFTFMVTPDGKAELVAEKQDGGPLDAALTRAKARGTTKVTAILKGADMLTSRAFGPLIGASHETVNIKRKRCELLGLEGATRGVRYPRWQVTDAGLPLPGLPKLFEILGQQPWTVYRFLRTAHSELGGYTALDALKAGRVDAVVVVAKNQASGIFT